MNYENLSRRSFLKTSSVLLVGVGSASLFTGLVHAGDAYEPHVDENGNCIIYQDGGYVPKCSYDDPEDFVYHCDVDVLCCYKIVYCRGELAVSRTWRCVPEHENDYKECMALPYKKPPFLPACDPLA